MFEGIHYKRWRVRAVLWFQTMSCYDATLGKPEGEQDAQQAQAFQKMDTLFKAALLSVLGENIVDAYASIDNGKDMWDALEAMCRCQNRRISGRGSRTVRLGG